MTLPVNPNPSVPLVSVNAEEQEKKMTWRGMWNFFVENHDLHLLDSELNDIIHMVNKWKEDHPDAPKASVEAKRDLGLTDAQSDNAEAVLQNTLNRLSKKICQAVEQRTDDIDVTMQERVLDVLEWEATSVE